MAEWKRSKRGCGVWAPVAGVAVVLGLSAAVDAMAQGAADPATAISTVDTYVKVVGGAVAAVATILGLPLVYQTFRKTQAEITKIGLEAEKLAREASGASPSGPPDSPQAITVSVNGQGHVVSITTDPRLKGPLLVLVDALIAVIFSQIAAYAVDVWAVFTKLPDALYVLVLVGIYAALFLPVLKAAFRVKKELGAEGGKDEADGGSNRPRWWDLRRR